MVELIPDPDADRIVKPALRSFHDEAHTTFVPPHFGAVRARGGSRHRRRFAAVTAAAAALVAVAGVVTGMTLVRSTTTHPPTTTTQSPYAPPSSAAPTPSPAPSSLPPSTPGRTIADTDWPNATITMGPSADNEYCPAGPVRFRNGEATVGDQAVWMWKNATVSYGDLDGDGAPEAVLPLACAPAEASGDWSGNLVVVSLLGEELTVLGYAGPLGVRFSGYRVSDGRLVTQVRPMHDPWAAEQRRTYEWTGVRFVQVAGHKQFVDLRDAEVALQPLTGGTARGGGDPVCPGGAVRFKDGAATTGAASYRMGAGQPVDADPEAQFTDLTGDGNAELLLPIRCTSGTLTGGGLYVLTLRTDGSYTALDVAFASHPWNADGRWLVLVGYKLAGRDLDLSVRNHDSQAVTHQTRRWNGKAFT